MRSLRPTAAIACALLAGTALHAAEPARSLTLQQAVHLALQRNSQVHLARARLDDAEAGRKSARGKLAPSLDLDATINIWDSAVEPALVEIPGVDLPSFTVRDQVTSQLSLTLSQPLGVQFFKSYKLSRLQRDAARSGLEQAQQDVVLATAQAYIQLKQALAGEAIAAAAVQQVSAQLKQGQALERAGVIGRNDLLKIEVARAQAEAGEIRAQGAVSLARSALALTVGLPPDTALDPAQPFADPPPAFEQTLDHCSRRALAARPELAAGRTNIELADAGADLARWSFAPVPVALLSYVNVQGQGVFYPKNSFFVGGALKWNLWQWGGTYYEMRSAEQKLSQAEAGVSELRKGILLQVRKSFYDLETAAKTLAVARTAVQQATEAHRIEQVKYTAGSSTTTDLLDAQLALTRARLTTSNALHGWYLARAALARAMGEALPFDEFTGGSQ